jgi:hypothetical protein
MKCCFIRKTQSLEIGLVFFNAEKLATLAKWKKIAIPNE